MFLFQSYKDVSKEKIDYPIVDYKKCTQNGVVYKETEEKR